MRRSTLVFFLSCLFYQMPSYGKSIPQRIVSCSVAGDEILLQILKTKEDRKRLLAVSSFADDARYSTVTEEAREIRTRTGTNIEQLLALKPDLVIAASFNQPEFVSLLKKLNMKVHIMEGFQSLADLKRHIQELGTLVGVEAESRKLNETMMEELERFKKSNTKGIKILPILSDRTLVGKNTLLDDILTHVGFRNVVSEMGIVGWQKISEEKLLTLNPDRILTSAEENSRDEVYKTLSQSPALKKWKALEKEKLILVPPALFSSFSPKFLKILPFLELSGKSPHIDLGSKSLRKSTL